MLQSEWGWTVVFDLFLSGFGGCLFVLVAICYLVLKEQFAKIAHIGAWIAFGSIAGGVLFLLADVGQPLRAVWMFGSFVNFSSWMPRGAWALAITMVVLLLFALSFQRPILRKAKSDDSAIPPFVAMLRKILCVVGIVLGLFVTTYTGLLLKESEYIPLWNTWYVPISFICLSGGAGSAAALALMCALDFEGEDWQTGKVVAGICAGCMIAAGVFVGAFVSKMSSGSVGAQSGVHWMLSSPAFALFAIGVIGSAIGSLASFVARTNKKMLRCIVFATCVLAIIAGISFRYCVLGGGTHEALFSIDATQMLNGVTYLIH